MSPQKEALPWFRGQRPVQEKCPHLREKQSGLWFRARLPWGSGCEPAGVGRSECVHRCTRGKMRALIARFPPLCAVRQSPEPVRLYASVVVIVLPLPVCLGRGSAAEGGQQHRAVHP